MTINRTTLLDLPLPVTGTESGTWGDVTNNGLSQYVDIAIAGMNSLTSSDFTAGALTISLTEGNASATNIAAGTAQYATIKVSSLAQNSTITAPASARSYRIINADATYNLTIKASGQTGVTFLPGTTGLVAFNGTDYEIVGVVGPASATDNAVVRFDSTTGQVIQNSGVTIDDSNNVSGVAQLNATTADLTNIEVTNIKAKDGTAAGSIADSTGVVTLASSVLTTTDINGGTIDNTAIGGATPAAGAFTTLAASSTLSVTGAGTIQGLTVGRGAGAVATNTAVGASALAANTSGTNNTAVGSGSLDVNTSGSYNSAFGRNALGANTNGAGNTAVGFVALAANTGGSANTAVGDALNSNTTGNYNAAFGSGSLASNTTASNNTAVGFQAGYSNTTGTNIVALGYGALYSNTTGENNTAVGFNAGRSETTGGSNTFFGLNAGYYQNGAGANTFIGREAGLSVTTGSYNTFVGAWNGSGAGSGSAMTTGSKNTIIGGYTGNQGGLDIRTSSNWIVLSDGDGNPRAYSNGSGNWGIACDPDGYRLKLAAPLDTSNPNKLQAWSPSSLEPTTYFLGLSSVFAGSSGTGGFRYQFSGTDFFTGTNTYVGFQAGATLIGGATYNSSGAKLQVVDGITFPATQVASSDANTLDDYERGTFTATLKGGTTDPTTPVTATCQYSKIGRTVNVYIGFENVDTTGASGAIQVSGLPFAASSTVRTIGTAGSFLAATFPADTYLIGTISLGGSVVDIQYIVSNAGWAAATHNTGTGRYLWAQFTYETAT